MASASAFDSSRLETSPAAASADAAAAEAEADTSMQRRHKKASDATRLDKHGSTLKALSRITQHPALTPYRRRVYRTLLSVPPGRWTTYAALAAHLGSGPRAVGNAMRTNPFAPAVPCHRVLAADRTLGGYKGEWQGGRRGQEKRLLLEAEGVRFDDKGRAQGDCFRDFADLQSVV